jgi:hypothetical protein
MIITKGREAFSLTLTSPSPDTISVSRGSSVRRRSSHFADHHRRKRRKVIEFQIEVFCFVSVYFLNNIQNSSIVQQSRILVTFLKVLFLGLDPSAL